MRKTLAYVVAISLVLIALGKGGHRYFFSDGEQMMHVQTQPAVTTRGTAASNLAATPASAAIGADNAGSAEPVSIPAHESPMSVERLNASTSIGQHDGGKEAKTPEGTLDPSVVGYDFPISESVRAQCMAERPLGKQSQCYVALEILAQFKREPRDESWAAAKEAALRNYLQGEPGYTLRALECRTSVCSFESSSVGSGLPISDYEFATANGLLHVADMRGYETDPSGTRIYVVTEVFTRR